MNVPAMHAGFTFGEIIMASNSKDSKDSKGSKQDDKTGNRQSADAGNSSTTSKRGFASMDPEQQRAIAAEGGRAAHAKGTAHEFTSEEARRAGSMSHKNNPGRTAKP
jgi:general stress protein YciG